jgi:hypothetical protein
VTGTLLACTLILIASNLKAQPQSLGNIVDEWQDRVARPGFVWGSQIGVENEPCCSPSAGTQTANGAEAPVLATMAERASRDGKTLKLRLDHGRTLKIVDCDEACAVDDYRVHRLVTYWPQYRYYVLSIGYYEGQGGFLIDEANGEVISVVAPPVLSPSGRYAIAWDSSLENDRKIRMEWFNLQERKIFPISPGPGQCPGRTEYAHPGPQPVWLSDEGVAFDRSGFLVNNSPQFRMTLRIVAGLNLVWKCEI